ncbi:lipid kinase YegS [Mesorhizobium sp. BR1-1-16]|uniref:lipid kinase YegS n=1 Tax=Mesorhizobium sp. BR1-1-16 TaxID=2876653 RepID=UPI001CC8EE66|nr:lipid kinase YegS [Mesorhizobium sp. BR1-1-16]MBZ9936605.1 lipid kinase YegS [Mesorhizobium sp. BR1-1-16]
MRLRLIVHGKVAREARVHDAVDAVRADGHVVSVRVTFEAGDAGRMAAEAVAEAKAGALDAIIAGGGDGTVNEVFAAALAADPPPTCSFGVLPLGTANDFARSADLPASDATAALRLAVTRAARPIDVGLVDGRPFINLLTGGFGSRVTVETDPDLKRSIGGLAYVLTGVSRFRELAANSGRITGEGFAWEGAFLALAIGNGRFAGGGILLCPDALLDDGALDLMVLPELPAEKRLDALTGIVLQGAAALPGLQVRARSSWFEYRSDKELSVNLDGEPIKARRFRVECRPRALNLHLGPAAVVTPLD